MDQKPKSFLRKYNRPIYFIVIGLVTYAGFIWWCTTPYHALREIRRAIKMHDQETFNKYVDVAGVVTNFTEDVIYKPAEKTKDLGKFQRIVGIGALEMTKTSINNSLIFKIQKWVAHGPGEEKLEPRKVCPKKLEPENNQVDKAIQEIEEGPSIATVLTEEIKFEKEKLKQKALDRMTEYAEKNPDTLVNKIFVSPSTEKGLSFRRILRHYGFIKKNLKKVDIKMQGEKCICTLFYYCPITEKSVPVYFELTKEPDGQFTLFRVQKIIKLKETFGNIGEDTDKQVQGLVKYGLKDITFQSALKETKNFFKRLKTKGVGQ